MEKLHHTALKYDQDVFLGRVKLAELDFWPLFEDLCRVACRLVNRVDLVEDNRFYALASVHTPKAQKRTVCECKHLPFNSRKETSDQLCTL